MIRQMIANTRAQDFWRTTIDGYTEGNFQETTEPVLHYKEPQIIQRFSNKTRRASKAV